MLAEYWALNMNMGKNEVPVWHRPQGTTLLTRTLSEDHLTFSVGNQYGESFPPFDQIYMSNRLQCGQTSLISLY